MDAPLTPRQQEVVRWIYDYVVEHGQYPTIRAVMHGMGFRSPNAVMNHLEFIAKKGYVEFGGNVSRAIRLCGMRLAPVFDGEAGERLMAAVCEAEPAEATSA